MGYEQTQDVLHNRIKQAYQREFDPMQYAPERVEKQQSRKGVIVQKVRFLGRYPRDRRLRVKKNKVFLKLCFVL